MDKLYDKFAGGSLERIAVLLCLIGTYRSVSFIVLMQMNYAIAPRQFFTKNR